MNPQIREQNIEALIQKGRAVMALQDNAWSTEQQYLGYVRRFFRFAYTQSAKLSSEQKFENWLTEMVLKHDCSVSTQDVAFAAICWFYKDVLKRPLKDVNALRATKPKQIRNAPSVTDVRRLLADVRDVGGYPTNFLTRLLYERGMRVGEPVALQVKDLRFEQREIFIHAGKNKTDRIIAMPDELVADFQRQLIIAHRTFEMDCRNKIPIHLPNQLGKKYPEMRFSWQHAWVFPAHRTCEHPRTGEIGRWHMLKDYVQQAVRESRRRLGIFVLPHELRHGFATHLLDSGINMKALQGAMGHKNIETTSGYCHAEAKSVPCPSSRLRFNPLVAVELPAVRRLEFQNIIDERY
jgi:site-specific recombinase XerD